VSRSLIASLATAALSLTLLHASVRHVPGEYATIQAALDAVQNDDTVLVALATYAEELSAPPRRFWLIGDVEIDTGIFARPVIDPSSLDSARWRECVGVPAGCELTIERMAFVNHAAMYPRAEEVGSGGIMLNSAETLTLRYCTFDSVYHAITSLDPQDTLQARVVIADCRFTNAQRCQVCPGWYERVEIRRSLFDGRHFWSHYIYAGDSSVLEDCTFKGDSINGVIVLEGQHGVIHNCVFGPMDSLTNPVIRGTDMTVEGNAFTGLRTNTNLLLVGWNEGDPVIINHNYFAHNGVWADNAWVGISVSQLGESPAGFAALIDSNVFAFNAQVSAAFPKAIWLDTRVSLTGNHFRALQPLNVPCIDSWSALPGTQLRFNQFEAGDYAIRNGSHPMDAILNYWGDPTGPYNAGSNPEGLGARIDDNIFFDPWSPDTTFLWSPRPRAPLPQSVSLEIFPNPFNATATLKLVVTEPGIFQIDLFNLLGQHVQQIWSGAVAYEKQIAFDGKDLASGLYFVRVFQPVDNRVETLQKVVIAK